MKSGKPSKAPTTIRIILRALLLRAFAARPRRKTEHPRRIIVAHQLPIGDTLMLTPLLAKLRERYPIAEISIVTSTAMAPLYQKRPYGVIALPFNPRELATLPGLLKHRGFDLAIVPGDNRHSWLAAALDARWIVAHSGDRPWYKNLMIDESLPYPTVPTAMGDMFAELVEGPRPQFFSVQQWQEPDSAPFVSPAAPYAVLHVGATGQMKRWEPEKWRTLADWLSARTIQVVWSGADNEAKLVAEIDPGRRFASYAGQLDLAQLWRLIAGACLLVCPDTGVAHMARLTGTPVVTLFGPGTPVLFGAGEFWRDSAYVPITIEDFPCRDQQVLLRRPVPWARRCTRGPSECAAPRCMQAIDARSVIDAAERLLSASAGTAVV